MSLDRIALFLLVLISLNLRSQRLAIMGAMDEEIAILTDSLKNKKELTKGGVTFYKGKLKGKKVIILKAGIGKVNAAYSTAILLDNFKVEGLIFTGVAGGLDPEIKPGDIVIGENLVQYDFGELKNDTFETWPTRNLIKNNARSPLFLPVDKNLLALSTQASASVTLAPIEGHIPKFYVGTIVTGDTFVSDASKAKNLYTDFNALATEMEGAAVAQVSTMLGVPFIVIRSCSDNANSNAHTDYFKFVKIASVNSAQLVLAILERY
ncbi:MAG: 5'-methylthioadenosine/adenosylhomocysteine nucleosidase [Flavobacteriaceae bacterium]